MHELDKIIPRKHGPPAHRPTVKAKNFVQFDSKYEQFCYKPDGKLWLNVGNFIKADVA